MKQTFGLAGLGLLGRGIATCLLAHDLRVIAYTPSSEEFVLARQIIAQSIEELIQYASFPASLRETWQQNFQPASSVTDFSSCDFIIESITESFEVKSRLFDEIEQAISSETPIASNTSAIPIARLQQNRKYPERFVGMHWAEPAHATRFLEIIPGNQTSSGILEQVSALARTFGKEPCVVHQDMPGFLANRLGYALYREACFLLEQGVADAETIDISFRNSIGLWASVCGPFRWMDLTGGPALYGRAMRDVLPTLSATAELPPTMQKIIESHADGVRSGHGFFSYTEEEAHRWEDLYRRNVWNVRSIVDPSFPL